MSPQATLDPKIVPWETRFANGKNQDWSLPYSDAAKGIKEAANAFVFYDSLNRLDLRHARMLATTPSTTLLPIPAGGHGVPPILVQMGMIKSLTREAIAGTLDRASFFKAIRIRKKTPRYYRILAQELLLRRRYLYAVRVSEVAARKYPRNDFLELKAVSLAAAGKPVLAIQTLDDARKARQKAS